VVLLDDDVEDAGACTTRLPDATLLATAGCSGRLFSLLIHLDDLELELAAGFQMRRLSIRVDGLRIVTQAFDAFGNLDKGAEIRHAQNLAMDDVADAVFREE